MLDLALLYQLLEVDEEDGLRALVAKARQVQSILPQLVLSVAKLEGHQLGSGSGNELQRALARAADYDNLCAAIAPITPFQVVKGPQLARRYPDGARRPVGDLDVVVPDQASLWRAAYEVIARRPTDNVDFSLFGAGYIVLTVTWAPEDPILDEDLSTEISNAALPGEFHAVPVRAALPDDDWTAALIALAEERLQRPFDAKDAIDLVTLASDAPGDAEPAAEVIDAYSLSPEVVELLDFAREKTGLDKLANLADALRGRAAAETARRATLAPMVQSTDVETRLALGQPVHGMLLRRHTDRADWAEYRMHRFDGGILALTPVADYLLVSGAVVRISDYEAAQLELARLDG
jgi:hypothetical protein